MTDDEITQQKNAVIARAKAILEEHFNDGIIMVASQTAGGRYGDASVEFGNPYVAYGLAAEYVHSAGRRQ